MKHISTDPSSRPAPTGRRGRMHCSTWRALVPVAVAALLMTAALTRAQAAAPTTSPRTFGVEIKAPGRPYFGAANLPRDDGSAFGPGSSGTLAITSMTVTNDNATAQRLLVVQTELSAPATDCQGTRTGNGYGIYLTIEANSTRQFTFPSPWVLTPSGGNSCFAAINRTGGASSVWVHVVGFID